MLRPDGSQWELCCAAGELLVRRRLVPIPLESGKRALGRRIDGLHSPLQQGLEVRRIEGPSHLGEPRGRVGGTMANP